MTHVAHIGSACLLVAGLLLLYAEPLAGMVSQWNASPMYSYAFTVPVISLFVLWSQRRAFLARSPRPARFAGGAVLAAALVLLVLGQVAAVQIVQQFSFVVAIVGIVLFLFGPAWLGVAAPALGYLLFMLPFWDTFTESLHWPFQNNSAKLGVAMLHAVGIPAYREGTLIALSNITLEVARACSGVNYLIAVLALALPLSYLRLRGGWPRVLLIGSALVIAALANGLRVALIGALAYWEIGSPLHGPFHVLHGLFVAGVGYVALFSGLHLLERRHGRAGDDGSAAPASRSFTPWRVADACTLAAVFLALVFLGTTPGSTPVALAMPLERLPNQLGAWVVDPMRVEDIDRDGAWREADHQLRRRYYTPDGHGATVHIWYFEAQRQSREIINFKAANLHRDAVVQRIEMSDGTAFTANVVRWPGYVGLFWYELDGAPESDQYAAKLRSLWTALSAGRSNGAAIILRAPDTGSEALVTLQGLAAEVHVALASHWRHRLSAHARRATGSSQASK
jgi:exosortase